MIDYAWGEGEGGIGREGSKSFFIFFLFAVVLSYLHDNACNFLLFMF